MREAAAELVGEHDFSAFQNTGRPVKSAVRVIQEILIEEEDPLLHFWFTANGFLYQMVRIIVGTLLEIGQERLEPAVVRRALDTGRRELLGPTVPAHGLCLERVTYLESIFAE
jgi:tRNA pseudouridine38-40 synthase